MENNSNPIQNAIETPPLHPTETFAKFVAVTGMNLAEIQGLRRAIIQGRSSGTTYGRGVLSDKKAPVCAIGFLMRERGFAFDCDIDHVSCAVRYLAPQVQASEATRIMHDFEFTFFKVSPQGRKDPDNVEVVEAIDELIRSNRKVL